MARTMRDLALLLAAIAVTTGIAELLGAANAGTALTYGELAFVATLLWLLLAR